MGKIREKREYSIPIIFEFVFFEISLIIIGDVKFSHIIHVLSERGEMSKIFFGTFRIFYIVLVCKHFLGLNKMLDNLRRKDSCHFWYRKRFTETFGYFEAGYLEEILLEYCPGTGPKCTYKINSVFLLIYLFFFFIRKHCLLRSLKTNGRHNIIRYRISAKISYTDDLRVFSKPFASVIINGPVSSVSRVLDRKTILWLSR